MEIKPEMTLAQFLNAMEESCKTIALAQANEDDSDSAAVETIKQAQPFLLRIMGAMADVELIGVMGGTDGDVKSWISSDAKREDDVCFTPQIASVTPNGPSIQLNLETWPDV